MISILLRYTFLLLTTLLVLVALSFALAYLFPGEVLANLSGVLDASPQQQLRLAEKYKTDASIPVQFIHYLQLLITGDWGRSFASGIPLKTELMVALPATIELSVYAMCMALFLGLPLGYYAGVRCYTLTDYSINSASLITYSLPVFWLALVIILVFSLELGVSPLSGRISLMFDIPRQTGFILVDILLSDIENKRIAIRDALSHLVLPTLAIGSITTASMIRITRRAVIDSLRKPYISAARTRGLSELQIFFRHVIRNALLTIMPLLAFQITTLVTNAMIVETLFSWPGVGNWLLQAIYQRDYPALRIGMLAVSTLVITVTITIDMLNRLFDPSKERYARGAI